MRHIGFVGGDADDRVGMHRAGAATDAGRYCSAGNGGCSHANCYGNARGYTNTAAHRDVRSGADFHAKA